MAKKAKNLPEIEVPKNEGSPKIGLKDAQEHVFLNGRPPKKSRNFKGEIGSPQAQKRQKSGYARFLASDCGRPRDPRKFKVGGKYSQRTGLSFCTKRTLIFAVFEEKKIGEIGSEPPKIPLYQINLAFEGALKAPGRP